MMVWTWVLSSPRVLGTERYHGLGMDALESVGDAKARQLPESKIPESQSASAQIEVIWFKVHS